MFDVVGLGELLIDFTPVPAQNGGTPCFAQHPGGAPANVLVTLSRLGKRTAFIGKVGDDQFGQFLADLLAANAVDAKGLVFEKQVNTTLAFVHLDSKGDRSFSFYRRPGADMMLREDEVDFRLVTEGTVFHFGSVSLTDEPVRSATLAAAARAKQARRFVSYDPNLRPLLWHSLTEAKEVILEAAHYADLIKISEEELYFLVGTTDLASGSAELVNRFNLTGVLVTLGEHGCFYRIGAQTGTVPGFSVDVVDTTGAGDAFFGGFLASALDSMADLRSLATASAAELERMIRFANAVGALTTTQRGAISAIPDRATVERFLEEPSMS